MMRPPPKTTRTDTLFPYTTRCRSGEEVEIVGIRPTQKTTVTGVEMFRKLLDQGQAGDNIGALLRGTKREDVERGQVLCKPGSVKPHTKRSEEHTSELQSLMRISYAVFCLKKTHNTNNCNTRH